MSCKKPENIEKYKDWLRDEHEQEIKTNYKGYYDSIVSKIKFDFEKSDFWIELIKNLSEYHDEYFIETGYPLLLEFQPIIDIKSFKSFFLKTYRKNILENKNWPNEPDKGWILPTNWFTQINDIIRTMLVVKYLDGIEFTTKKLNIFCKSKDMYSKIDFEAKEEGYYAAHFYTKKTFEILDYSPLETKNVEFFIEIQITSQLQEIIRTLLHKYYEGNRKKLKKNDEKKWQWKYDSPEFATNYLGHILHYIEGMIMEIREEHEKGEEIEK